MAHPGRLFAELGFPVTPVLPHILARAVNASDFRPSSFLFESPRSLPIGIIGGRYQVYSRSPLPLKVGACRREVRSIPIGMVPNLQVTKVHIHRPCGPSSFIGNCY